jgi:hypothetical protein
MMGPRYREVKGSQIPEVALANGVKAKIISGQVNGTKGPVRDIVTDPEYLDITIPSKSTFQYPVKRGHTVFAYVIDGQGYFDEGRDSYAFEAEGANYFDFKRECLIAPENLVIYADGDEVIISTEDKGVRFLFVSGKPIKEPVAWYGPIVMNTQEELRIAFEEYQKGTFIKHR